jgi:hypothetical protein
MTRIERCLSQMAKLADSVRQVPRKTLGSMRTHSTSATALSSASAVRPFSERRICVVPGTFGRPLSPDGPHLIYRQAIALLERQTGQSFTAQNLSSSPPRQPPSNSAPSTESLEPTLSGWE